MVQADSVSSGFAHSHLNACIDRFDASKVTMKGPWSITFCHVCLHILLLVRKKRRDWDRQLSRSCRRSHKLSIEVSTPSQPKVTQGSSP